MVRNNLIGGRKFGRFDCQERNVTHEGFEIMRNVYSATSNISFYLEHTFKNCY